jgi:DNA-binding transcriptional regulator GbsR (MarR family)
MPHKSNNRLTEAEGVPHRERSPAPAALGRAPNGGTPLRLLLLGAEPTSLNRIMTDLEISKSSASVAARLLEQYTPARRHGERGSKRASCEVS